MKAPKVKQLSKDRNDFPYCQAKLSLITRKFWRGRARPTNQTGSDTCGCFATYRIDGKYFCRKHGSLYVLDKLAGVLVDD